MDCVSNAKNIASQRTQKKRPEGMLKARWKYDVDNDIRMWELLTGGKQRRTEMDGRE
jgi:hypothetical protein